MQNHAHTIAATCAAAGIRHVVICPGSRSAPLVYAFTALKAFRTYSVVDERSAGFMALGMAQQTRVPVALVCTSGTALLNFFPAVAEAFYQQVPLIVLSADRPPELLHQQDGQMIMQRNVYGDHVLKSAELPCYPEAKEDHGEVKETLTQLLRAASGIRPGPVHLNVPLREPLYPARREAPLPTGAPAFRRNAPSTKLLPSHFRALTKAWKESSRRMVLVGQMPANLQFIDPLLTLSRDAVILSDVLSNQQQASTSRMFDLVLSNADPATLDELKPDMLISLGGPVLSKSLKQWLKSFKPRHHFRIQEGSPAVNTYGNVTQVVAADPLATLSQLAEELSGTSDSTAYRSKWRKADQRAQTAAERFLAGPRFSELHIMKELLSAMPDAVNLHVGNSSVVRYISYLGRANASWRMNSNRGTSGIDGCTSTAVGAALVNGRLTVLITGDLAFLYDRNALWNRHVPPNLRIIVINNGGGGIFRLIDGPSVDRYALPFFTTPHTQNIRHDAEDNGLQYYFCNSQASLESGIRRILDPQAGASVLEVSADMELNAEVFRAFRKIRIRI